jgi:hypothetical protein
MMRTDHYEYSSAALHADETSHRSPSSPCHARALSKREMPPFA